MASINDLDFKQHRRGGSVIVTGTAATTGEFFGVECITACTFDTFTMANSTGTFTGIAYPVGTIIYGDITALTANGVGEIYIAFKK